MTTCVHIFDPEREVGTLKMAFLVKFLNQTRDCNPPPKSANVIVCVASQAGDPYRVTGIAFGFHVTKIYPSC